MEVTATQILMGPDKKGAAVTKAINVLAKALATKGWALSEDIELAAVTEKIGRDTLSRARKLLGVKQSLVGPVGKKSSFRVNWLPRQCGEDFDPNQCAELHTILHQRQTAAGAGREKMGALTRTASRARASRGSNRIRE